LSKDKRVCGRKYFCEVIEATTWCTEKYPCPKCSLSQNNKKEDGIPPTIEIVGILPKRL